jgi:hypothetical protein
MSINLNDNINVSAPLPIDNRYGNGSSLPFTAYASTTAANTATASRRYIGLTVVIGTPPVEYWYRNGIADADLVPKYYNVVTSGTSINTYISNSSSSYSQSYLDGTNNLMQAGTLPNSIGSSGVMSRILAFNKSASMWTNDYLSDAYEAQSKFLTSHPWVTMDSTHSFQIFDSIAFTNADGTFVAKYFDQRVNNENWQETYNNESTLTGGSTYTLAYYVAGDDFNGMTVTTISGTINTSGWKFTYTSGTPTTWTNGSIILDSSNNRYSGSTTLVNGQVYTLTSLAGGDNFNIGIGTTYPGTTGSPTSPPWTFTSNGTQPTWTNGSIVEGDFPYIPEDQKASSLRAELASSGTFSGKGVLSAYTNSFDIYGMLDQSYSTRGTVFATMTTSERATNIPTPKEGEIIYNTTTNTLNYYNGTSWVSL